MYEHLRNELLTSLSKTLDLETTNKALACIDKVMINYDVCEKTKELVVYGNRDFETLKMYIASRQVEGYSNGTLKNYFVALRLFLGTMQKPIDQITTNDIRLYLSWYKNNRNIHNAALDKLRQTLNAFFNWCVLEGYIDINPCTRIPKIKFEYKERDALEPVEMEAIIYEGRTLLEKAIFETLYSTGCRVTELINIKISDYNKATRQIKVFGKGKKERIVFMSDRAYIAVNKYLETRTDTNPYLFVTKRSQKYNKHICMATVRKMLHEAAENAEVVKPCTPHVIRHTTATVALTRGMPLQSIQIMLGHSSISTTEIYAKKDIGIVQQEHKRYVN